MGIITSPRADREIRSPGGLILPRWMETFDRADDGSAVITTDLGWTRIQNNIWIIGETAEVQVQNAEALYRLEVDLGTPDHFVAAHITNFAGSFSSNHSNAGLIARAKSTMTGTTSTWNHYRGELTSTGNASLYSLVNGSQGSIGGSTPAHPGVPFWIALTCQGDQIKFWINDAVVVSVTNTNHTTGNFVGLSSFRQTNTKVRYNTVIAGPL